MRPDRAPTALSSEFSRESAAIDGVPGRPLRPKGSSARKSKIVFKSANAELVAKVSARNSRRRDSLAPIAPDLKDLTTSMENWTSGTNSFTTEVYLAQPRARTKAVHALRQSILMKQTFESPNDVNIQGDHVSSISEQCTRGCESSPELLELPKTKQSGFRRTKLSKENDEPKLARDRKK